MNKIITFLGLTSLIFSNNFKILEIDKSGEFGKISTNSNLIHIGETGIVEKRINNNHSSIISYGEYLGNGKVYFKIFNALEQENLVRGNWKPNIGDNLLFRTNSNRAIIIADSFENYLQIEKKFNRDWIHPDLFKMVLTINGHRSPLLSDFREFCEENSVGRIFFSFKNSIVETDCLSMREISSYLVIKKAGEIQKPFYSRIEEIEPNWFGEGKDEIGEFESYYRSILERK